MHGRPPGSSLTPRAVPLCAPCLCPTFDALQAHLYTPRYAPMHATPMPHTGRPPTTPHGLPTCPGPHLHAPRPDDCLVTAIRRHLECVTIKTSLHVDVSVLLQEQPDDCPTHVPARTAPLIVPTSTRTTATRPFASPHTPSADGGTVRTVPERRVKQPKGSRTSRPLPCFCGSVVQHCFARLLQKCHGRLSPEHSQGDG